MPKHIPIPEPFAHVRPDVLFQPTDTVCFCFGYSREVIERDWLEHDGRSTILERIVQEKQAGGCQCTRTNPKGR
jgi:hypothetical protein